MGDRTAKDALFAEFAAVGKVLGNAKRLELLDLLSQGPRSVVDLAVAAELGMSTCSAHLQTLREAGLVEIRRDGKTHLLLAGRRRRRRTVGPPASRRPTPPPAH
jgi:DNA-binding transcriptional ArsR family regulator